MDIVYALIFFDFFCLVFSSFWGLCCCVVMWFVGVRLRMVSWQGARYFLVGTRRLVCWVVELVCLHFASL